MNDEDLDDKARSSTASSRLVWRLRPLTQAANNVAAALGHAGGDPFEATEGRGDAGDDGARRS
eukprot:5244676-Heterocapsa_arctica.AAC.1